MQDVGRRKSGGGKVRLRFKAPFAQEPEGELQLVAYARDRGGEIVASAPIEAGAFELGLEAKRVGELQLLIAPARPDLGERLPTATELARLRPYEPVLRLQADRRQYELEPIPAALSRLWLFCSCRVRGRVVKPVGPAGGPTIDMPVCDARVHICEVDPIWILLRRLPDPLLLRLRDELLEAIRKPWPPPPPGPGPLRELGEAAQLERAPRPQAIGRPPAAPAPSPQPARTAPTQLSSEAEATLASSSATTLRSELLTHVELIRPYLCWWEWLWPWWWSCDELAVVETDENGRFDVTVWYLCGDQPDLYFWVEYFIDGAWTTVYEPWRPCGTYWNYDCASEVTIRITDPRVPYCGCGSPADKTVIVRSIGQQVGTSEILGAAAGAREGLVPNGAFAGEDSPLGATLDLRVEFGDPLVEAGMRYRWRYQRLTDGSGASVSDSPHTMSSAVVRHYRAYTPDPVDLPYQLGPGMDGLFEVWNPTVISPAGNTNWQYPDEFYDLASGYLPSDSLDPTPGGEDAAAGRYELTLELFHSDGTPVDWTAEGIQLFEPDGPAPFGPGPVSYHLAPDEHRVLSSDGHTHAFRIVVHVDNSQCEAQIYEVEAPAPAGACGFIDYPSGASAHISFHARHPHDFAHLDFTVVKGSSGTVAIASVPGSPVGVASVNGFVRSSASDFAKDVAVADLVGDCAGGRAAFGETLYVYATAINGYSRLSGLDASATPMAFALTPAHPGPPSPPGP